MRSRLGLSLCDGVVRGVLLRGTIVLWTDHEALGATPSEARASVRALLSRCPRSWRTDVVVALGPAAAPYKLLDGFADAADAATLTAAMGANLDRFFIGAQRARLVAPARRTAHGWWAWTVDADVCVCMTEECRRVGLRLRGFVPSAAILGGVRPNGTLDIRDGSHGIRVVLVSGETISVRPLRPNSSAAPEQSHALITDQFEDARAAALLQLPCPSLWDPHAAGRSRMRTIARRALLVAVVVPAIAVSCAAPELRAVAESLGTSGLSARESHAAAFASSQLQQHRQSREAIDSIISFVDSRRSLLALIADLSGRLPEGSAILTLRVDARGASIVALAPPGIALLPLLGDVGGVASAQPVGAVTREVIQGREFQRIAVVLTFDRVARRTSVASPAEDLP